MKDILVFERVKNSHCHGCFFYPDRICKFRDIFKCEGSDSYKLAEEQPLKASKISVKLTGLNQDYEVVEEVIEIPDTGESVTTKESFFDRGARYDFKKEDPEKIQTEYEWKKERYGLLSKELPFLKQELQDECIELAKYLDANKPEKFEKATNDNVSVGVTVRGGQTKKKYTVNYISKSNKKAVFMNIKDEEMLDFLSNYEINTYKE